MRGELFLAQSSAVIWFTARARRQRSNKRLLSSALARKGLGMGDKCTNGVLPSRREQLPCIRDTQSTASQHGSTPEVSQNVPNEPGQRQILPRSVVEV